MKIGKANKENPKMQRTCVYACQLPLESKKKKKIKEEENKKKTPTEKMRKKKEPSIQFRGHCFGSIALAAGPHIP